MQDTITVKLTTDPYEDIVKIMDRQEANDPETFKRRGRPSALMMDHRFLKELKQTYAQLKSIRKTAEQLKISPTTVRKYIGPACQAVGRPAQPKAWQARDRTQIHAWFVRHKDETLPITIPALARYSGFKPNQVSRYLKRRHDAVLAYLMSLPDPREGFILFNDTMSRRLPSPLIKSFILQVDRFTLVVTMNCLLKQGGARQVQLGFQEFVDKLTSREL